VNALGRGSPRFQRQIKRLEDNWGSSCLFRSPRQISLTSEGELILDQARPESCPERRLRHQGARSRKIAGWFRFGATRRTLRNQSFAQRSSRNSPRTTPRWRLECHLELTLEILLEAFFSSGNLICACETRYRVKKPRAAGLARPWVWGRVTAKILDGAENDPVGGFHPVISSIASDDRFPFDQKTAALAQLPYTCGSLAGSLAAVRRVSVSNGPAPGKWRPPI